MKKFTKILELVLFLPTIVMFIITIIICWINRLLSLPYYFYKYKSKGFKYFLNDNIGFTKDILSNIF